jgi:glycosyltransferase involved in cell wall biosynthesis
MRVLVFTNMYPTPGARFYGSFVGDEVTSLRRVGVDVDVYFVNGRRNRLAYLAMPFGFLARLLRRKYDVVHVHHSFCGLVAVLQRKVPVVWTLHEGSIASSAGARIDPRAVKRMAYSRRLKRIVARRVDAVVAVSDRVRGFLERTDVDVIPSGIDLDLFVPMERAAARRAVNLPVERRYVLFPSSPSRPEKRYQLARRAVDRLREIAPDMRDVDMVVLDRVPHESVPFYMNAADVVLMTSAFEASPVTIREALACNIPVVSTPVGDVPQVLDGIEGCHVVGADAEEIARALRTVLSTARRVNGRVRMGAYSSRLQVEQLLSVYRRVVRGRGEGRPS